MVARAEKVVSGARPNRAQRAKAVRAAVLAMGESVFLRPYPAPQEATVALVEKVVRAALAARRVPASTAVAATLALPETAARGAWGLPVPTAIMA
jgi:hypothetical protein